MRTKETTPTWRARVEAAQRAGTRLARLFFLLIFFFNKIMDKRDTFYFNKMLLSFHLSCFTLQSNHLGEPGKLIKNKPSSGKVLVKRCSTINT